MTTFQNSNDNERTSDDDAIQIPEQPTTAPKRAVAVPQALPAPSAAPIAIGAAGPSPVASVGIGAKRIPRCARHRDGGSLRCEGLGSFAGDGKTRCRILTNIPEQIPIVAGEVALIETYYPALLALMQANDNVADTEEGSGTND